MRRRPPFARSPIAALLVALSLAPLLGACATTAPAPPPAPAQPPAATTPAAAATAAPAKPPNDIHWVRDSAEARAVFVQTYSAAAAALEERVAGREPFTWVVSLDGDETVLDNSLYQKERYAQGLGYTRESFNDWVRREEAGALPGVHGFLETVRGLGGKIAIVTNRASEVCNETESNLRKLRLPVDLVLCKPASGESDKAPRWQALEDGTADPYVPPLEIVMWVGDNIHDFPDGSQDLAPRPRRADPDADRLLGRFGEEYWIVPNPMYGSWEENPYL